MRATILMFVALTLSILLAGDPRAQTPLQASRTSTPPRAAQPGGRSKLFKDSRQSLAIARAQGRSIVTLLVAAEPGRTAMVDQQAAALGAHVRYRNDGVSYLRVDSPIDRVESLLASSEIVAVALDVDDGRDPTRLSDADATFGGLGEVLGEHSLLAAQIPQAVAESWPPTPSDFPLRQPYSALTEVDAAKMRVDHPTWDGRGVTIAVIDGTFDFLLPEFQTAYGLDGARIPKLADVINATDPETDAAFTPQWVDMRTVVEIRDRRVTHGGKTFSAPRDGMFRIGLFNERAFNVVANAAYIDQDVDRNGNPKGDDGLFGVLWDEGTNDVWVDTNRNLDFTDEKAMTDYYTRQDIGIFGTDDPQTPVRDSIGFTVQLDARKKFVSLNLGMYQHSTGILGAVAGNREPNGRINGLAPGARLVSIMYRSTAHALIEALILAFTHPAVDLIVLEQNTMIASHTYWLADARHPMSIVAQRLIDGHGKLLFVPGNNAPGFGIVAEDGLAAGAISVGGYQHRESYRVNYGFVPEADDNMHYGGLSHGPSGTGALKPDLLAPSGMMSTDVGFRTGDIKRGLYRLPPGYRIAGGTSTATPMAAASAALVVSAAKQLGLLHDAVRLKAALVGSARHIPRLAAHEQGNGLLQVGAAIERLRRLQSAPPMTIDSRAPVKTKLSHLLSTPHEGVGLFEREGWAPGDRGERTVTFTRTSGPAGPLTFDVRWLGDGAFSSPAEIALPLNTPVTFPVQIAVTEAGAHSAVLTLEHASQPGPVHRMLATIVAAHQFQADQGYRISTAVTVPRPGDRGVFVNVPPGASVLAIATEGGSARVRLIDPLRAERTVACFTPVSVRSSSPCAVGPPAAGVWEINLWGGQNGYEYDPEAPQPLKPETITVTATLLGVDVVASATAMTSRLDAALPLELTLTNRLGKTEAAATTLALGSGFHVSRTIAAGQQHLYEIAVPSGTTSLGAQLSSRNQTADLDIYLLDCSAPPAPGALPQEKARGNKAPPAPPVPCAARDSAADDTDGGHVEVPEPVAGRWVVVVDAFAVPSGAVEYEYRDFFIHPRFGTLAVTDILEPRDRLQQWTVKANAWVAESPAPPRRVLGRATVTNPAAVEFLLPRQSDFSSPTRREWRVPLGAADLELSPAIETAGSSRGARPDF